MNKQHNENSFHNIIKWTLPGLFFLPSACGNKDKEFEFPDKPIIVFIIADDMNWVDVGAYGSPHIRTPNLDRMAANGMKFKNAFLTTSSSSPSRASLITGLYPHQTDAEQLHWPIPGTDGRASSKQKNAPTRQIWSIGAK